MIAKRWRCPVCGAHKRTPPDVRATYHPDCRSWLDLIEIIEPEGVAHVERAGGIEIEDRSDLPSRVGAPVFN